MTDPVRPVAPREQLIADLRFFASGLAYRSRTPWEHGVMKLLMDAATEIESLAAAPVPCAASPADVVKALRDLRINANRLCDRQLGGTYEEDCRRSIARADEALRATGEGARDEEARDSNALGMRPVSDGRESADAGRRGRVDGDSVDRGRSSPHGQDVPQSDIEVARQVDASAAPQTEGAPVAVSLDRHRLLVEEILQRIESAQRGSIGSIENTYLAQIGVDEVQRWRARLQGEAAVRVEE